MRRKALRLRPSGLDTGRVHYVEEPPRVKSAVTTCAQQVFALNASSCYAIRVTGPRTPALRKEEKRPSRTIASASEILLRVNARSSTHGCSLALGSVYKAAALYHLEVTGRDIYFICLVQCTSGVELKDTEKRLAASD